MTVDIEKLRAIIDRRYDGDEQEEHEVMLDALPRLLAVFKVARAVSASIKLGMPPAYNEVLLARVFRAAVHGDEEY